MNAKDWEVVLESRSWRTLTTSPQHYGRVTNEVIVTQSGRKCNRNRLRAGDCWPDGIAIRISGRNGNSPRNLKRVPRFQ